LGQARPIPSGGHDEYPGAAPDRGRLAGFLVFAASLAAPAGELDCSAAEELWGRNLRYSRPEAARMPVVQAASGEISPSRLPTEGRDRVQSNVANSAKLRRHSSPKCTAMELPGTVSWLILDFGVEMSRGRIKRSWRTRRSA
jgi:hypothetical protein